MESPSHPHPSPWVHVSTGGKRLPARGRFQYRLGSHRAKRMIGNPNEALLPMREYARGKAQAFGQQS